jgi:cytochrome c peroxidase
MLVAIAAVASAAIVLFVPSAPRAEPAAPAAPAYTLPRGLQDMEIVTPADNPLTAGKIALGEMLFFDTRLSRTKKMSCETCHVPEKGWTDGLALSPKFDGSANTRHTPTLYGVAFYPDLYWDGRAKGLEAQILAAWKGQMGAAPDTIAAEVAAIKGYASAFEKEFGGPPTADAIVKALASFVRTIQAGDTPWDRRPQDEATKFAGDVGAGFKVFSETAHCTNCHLPPFFSDQQFHNVGIGFDKEKPDFGRGKFLADAAAKAGQPVPAAADSLAGAFKTPSLRGLALSGPYFHDGRAATLAEAVDLMLRGGIKNDRLDGKLQAWTVTDEERLHLLAFLESLTPEAKPYKRPKLP